MSTFHFQHVWHLRATLPRVYAALADVDKYAEWWPQVRRTERLDEGSGRAAIRSFLPYTLHLVLRREVEDEGARLLRVGVTGDLEGWCQWRLAHEDGSGGTCLATFEQEARVTPRLLARSASVTGPLLRANHAWMMRCGEVGLAGYLAEDR